MAHIATAYHAWRGEPDAGAYSDVPGFCKSVPIEQVRKHGHLLVPSRYVGSEQREPDGQRFEEKMRALCAGLTEQIAESERLDASVRAALKQVGFDV